MRGSSGATSNAPVTWLRSRTTTSWPTTSASLGRLTSIAVPVLVVHGTADPLFPVGHGEALAEDIPGASLLRLDGAGHGVDPWNPTDWPDVVRAVLDHTRGA